MTKSPRQRTANLLLLLAALVVVVLGAELIVRALDLGLPPEPRIPPFPILDAYHPYLQSRPPPSEPQLHTNAAGFRGEPITREKPPGAFRVFVMGGSAVFCLRTPYEKTHVFLLQQRLREQFPERFIEVQNAGADWHTTQHSLIKYLIQIRDYQPDLVVLWHGINDLVRSFSPEAFAHGPFAPDYSHYFGATSRAIKEGAERPRGREPILRIRLYLIDAMRSAIHGPEEDEGPARVVEVERFQSLPSFRRNLELLIEALERDGVGLILASQPSLYSEHPSPEQQQVIYFPRVFCREQGRVPSVRSMARGMAAFNRATEEIARAHGVGFVDLAAAIPKDLKHMLDDVHYTEQGNQRVAATIFAHIVDNGWVR
jgi:hypothetical protein